MKRFSERSAVKIGIGGITATAAVLALAVYFDELPFFGVGQNTYSAYFANAGVLRTGTAVQVSGADVGRVSDVVLDGTQVLVKFTVARDVHVGDRSEVSIDAETLLGTRVVAVIPRGDKELSEAIPLERTRSPYDLPDALGELTETIEGLNTDQLSESFTTLTDTFKNTPPELRSAADGVSRLAKAINTRDDQLRALLADAEKVTNVFAKRSDQIVRLVSNADALLSQLLTEGQALDRLTIDITAMSRQLSAVINDNRETIGPALEKLNGALKVVDNRKDRIQSVLHKFPKYGVSLGESVASGPFFKGYISNLLPGQFIQPFIDAAFSDLGLDPSVLLPSERFEPQTGQPATPALPSAFPRTGQGGEPRMTIPDAITGKPGDDRYPYREPPPAPEPGGPPPGPPAVPPAQPSAPDNTSESAPVPGKASNEVEP